MNLIEVYKTHSNANDQNLKESVNLKIKVEGWKSHFTLITDEKNWNIIAAIAYFNGKNKKDIIHYMKEKKYNLIRRVSSDRSHRRLLLRLPSGKFAETVWSPAVTILMDKLIAGLS